MKTGCVAISKNGFIGGTRFEVEYAVSLGIPVHVHWENGLSEWIFQHSFPFSDGKKEFFLAWEGFLDYAFRPEGLFDGPFGSNLKTSDYTQGGVRVVRIENIGFLSFLEEKRTYVSAQKYETLKKHTVGEGDLIFASFISDGVRVVVLPKVEKAIAKADCFCLRPLPQLVDSRYLAMILSSRQTYSELIGGIHGATRPRITTKQLRNLTIPLAPLEEQREIVDRVESLFKIADKIEKRVGVELSRTEKMTQAILAKAFRGELVSTEAEFGRIQGRVGG